VPVPGVPASGEDAPPARPRDPARVALIAGAVMFLPVTVCVLAARGTLSLVLDAREVGWRAVTTRRMLWLTLIASVVVIGSLPQTPSFQDVDGAVAFILLAAAGGLVYQWSQHRGQQRWRETAGRMTPTEAAPGRHRSPSVTDRLSQVERETAGIVQSVEALRTGLVRAFEAGGQDAPDELGADDLEQTRPLLRVLPGGRKTGS
jgi:hypothetical protein